jgi:hypothetical protein
MLALSRNTASGQSRPSTPEASGGGEQPPAPDLITALTASDAESVAQLYPSFDTARDGAGGAYSAALRRFSARRAALVALLDPLLWLPQPLVFANARPRFQPVGQQQRKGRVDRAAGWRLKCLRPPSLGYIDHNLLSLICKYACHSPPPRRKDAPCGPQERYAHSSVRGPADAAVRDEFENNKADLEKQLSTALGAEWKVDINPLAVYPYAEADSYAQRSFGACLKRYVRPAPVPY